MKLSRLYSQNQAFQNQGLPKAWGDGYLMAHNRLYRGVRQGALRLGYQFSSAPNKAYAAFPLLQLEDILQKRVLPYADNSSVFDSLSTNSREALTWEDVDGNLRRNFVFHEASHGIARDLMEKHGWGRLKGTGIEVQRDQVLRALFEESCANAVELLGALEVSDPVHRAFYETNSYICMFQDRTHLARAAESIGFRVLFKFMVFSYLQANFLRTNFEDRDFLHMLAMSREGEWSGEEKKTLRALGKIAFQLSLRFREQTTGFHLRLVGIQTPIGELFAFDFMSQLKKKKDLEPFLNEFLDLISG